MPSPPAKGPATRHPLLQHRASDLCLRHPPHLGRETGRTTEMRRFGGIRKRQQSGERRMIPCAEPGAGQ